MAFRLGQAIVEFRAKGVNDVTMAARRATRTLSEMSKAATGVALSLGAGAFTAAAVGAIKLAANVETVKTQFSVLLKDMDAAERLLGEITSLASETPFAKMELADAARMMLAFGVAADDVVGELRRIGDISALTGNSIGEIAEIYGKAKVQGRLFAEDINQLTGRGIPIIQELAKQFGVAESEVKKLVETGDVGFENIQQAFRDMTSEGGQFAGGMERLSQTTEGKLSTLRDQFKEIAVILGTELLPYVHQLADFLSSAFGPGGSVREAISGTGEAMMGLMQFDRALREGNYGVFGGNPFARVTELEAERLQREADAKNEALRRKFAEINAAQKAGENAVRKGGQFNPVREQQEEARAAEVVDKALSASTLGISELSRSVQQSALSQQVQIAEQTLRVNQEQRDQQIETNNLLRDGIDNGNVTMRLG